MADLKYVTGVTEKSEYVRVGHNSSILNNDAVWSFATPYQTKEASFTLSWDNNGAGTGWRSEDTYVFAVSTSGAAGRTAQSGTHLGKATVVLSGVTGTATVKVSGLSLAANTTYYLRANQNGTTYESMKAFMQDGNTVELTPSATGVYIDGKSVTTLKVNTNTVTTLKVNGSTIF